MSPIERIRKWIAVWIWIVEAQAAERNGQTKRQHRGGIQMDVLLDDRIVRDTAAQPDCGLSVPKRIPRKTKSRIEVSPPRLDARLAGKSRIAGISKPRRRTGNDRAAL